MRIHIPSLPHTEVNSEYNACAYTQKVRKFCNMMTSLGHEVFLYAGENSDPATAESITIATEADRERWFGKYDHTKILPPLSWNATDIHWVEFNTRVIREIEARIQPLDIIGIIGGTCQEQIAKAFSNKQNPIIEWGIGYDGIFADFKVFESYAHMHTLYGRLRIEDGKFYDCVIPNFFNISEFALGDLIENRPIPLTYLGRFIKRKGIEIAVAVAEKLDVELTVAGQGCRQYGNTFSGPDFSVTSDHINYIGHVSIDDRKELLSSSQCLIVPTLYIEPFGGVAVEAMLSGTPVVASDFGAFTETVEQGINGYRFRTIGEAAYGVQQSKNLDRLEIFSNARQKYDMNVIKHQYNDYFEQVLGLYYNRKDERYNDFYGNWHGSTTRYN